MFFCSFYICFVCYDTETETAVVGAIFAYKKNVHTIHIARAIHPFGDWAPPLIVRLRLLMDETWFYLNILSSRERGKRLVCVFVTCLVVSRRSGRKKEVQINRKIKLCGDTFIFLKTKSPRRRTDVPSTFFAAL